MAEINTLSWCRYVPECGNVWVQRDYNTGRFRWRCASRAGLNKWTRAIFDSVDDAFDYAERTLKITTYPLRGGV